MDAHDFREDSLGQLVSIDLPRSKVAFLPDPLPDTWEFPTSLWPDLAEAREAVASLDGIGRYMPNPNLLLRPLLNREALRSSSMEGTYATPEELLLYEAEPVEPESDKDKVNEWKEVYNYSRALSVGRRLVDEGYPLSLQLVRTLHCELLSGVRGQDKSPGEFRNVNVQIGHDARFVPPPSLHVNDCLVEMEGAMRRNLSSHCLIKAFMLHYQFETIHPFKDGNGRVGRLLLSLQIYTEMGLSNPWVYMSAYFEKYKDEYIDYLYGVSSKGNWERWLAFCLKGVKEQTNDTIKRVNELIEIKERYTGIIQAQSQASARLVQVVTDLFEKPILTIPQLAEKYDVTYPTAKTDIQKLEALGILVASRADRRPRYFVAHEILESAYGEE